MSKSSAVIGKDNTVQNDSRVIRHVTATALPKLSSILPFVDRSPETPTRLEADQRGSLSETGPRQEAALRIAGEKYLNTVVQAATTSRSSHSLYRICDYLAAETYESNPSIGKLVIAPLNHPNIDLTVELKHPVALKPQRMVRKLLEVASQELFLYSDGNRVLGFARMKGTYDPSLGNLLEIEFYGDRRWRLNHGGETLMFVKRSNPILPKPGLEKYRLIATLKGVFGGIPDQDIEAHWDAISSTIRHRHGALLVISSEAKKEAKRLERQATAIRPAKLDNGAVDLVTSIDGAILLDTKAVCHAIGMILDGLASSHGTPARGSRFNSAVRYVDTNSGKAVAVIISEDGTIDIYPDLTPQANRKAMGEQTTPKKVSK